ncbi:MAG TPA: sulfite exporter TauE/SafE family protein [Symbiobacteriaceae bacterium]|jgi:hypothetical protein
MASGLLVLVFSGLLSMAGLGAAFIYVPLFFWLGVPLHQAMSVALLLNFISLSFATVSYVRGRLVDFRAGLPALVLAVLFSPLGSYTAQFVGRRILLWLFAAFLLFAAYMMLIYRSRGNDRPAGVTSWFTAAVGGLAGFVGGLLGVGGGNIIVPALTWIGFDPKRAAATTAFIVVFSSLSGFLSRVSVAGLDWPFVGVTALASITGALAGSWLMKTKVNGRQLKQVIGVALVLMAAKILFDLVA